MREGKKNIAVSVVVPVYNVSAYIERCMASVMRQTYDCFECILVDDATPDDSIEKCKALIEQYDGPVNFRIVSHERNKGLSAARNTGTRMAMGDYILYVDSDDEISCDSIEKLAAPVERDSTIDFVVGNVEERSEGSRGAVSMPKKHEQADLRTNDEVREYYYVKKNIETIACNKLIKKDMITRFSLFFDENLYWEDAPWMFYVMQHVSHAYLINDVTYIYHRHPGSITTSLDTKRMLVYKGHIYEEITNHFSKVDSKREARFYIRGFCLNYIESPKSRLYAQAARKFRKELSFRHDLHNRSLLLATTMMRKTWPSRQLFHYIVRFALNTR
ncbi:glycosyltransferase family 2 protein [Prevotella sp. FD3004]|uniref:glycosyltransferase family 2 protein n=1 Tax=Prevotella sp. FD3004 TaxID=1408309 RepID=UPI00068CBD1F|nr:glycosyltransferase family 2 protein [Prevotella sp. FD3004]